MIEKCDNCGEKGKIKVYNYFRMKQKLCKKCGEWFVRTYRN